MQKQGILYVANGAAFQKEAVVSMRSVRRHGCDLPIVCRCTEPEQIEKLVPAGVTLEQIEPLRSGLLVKPQHVTRQAFEETLFLDTDTLIMHPDAFLPFYVLNRYPMALAYAPKRGYSNLRGVVNCVSTYNSGVMFYRWDAEVQSVFAHWKKAYPVNAPPRTSDQAVLSNVLWRRDVRVFVLPPEWNCRGRISGVPGVQRLRILHHRKATALQMRGRLNPQHWVTGKANKY